jgi:hypothetical protein
MTWVRTEDTMPLHPKVLLLSDGAYRLWSNALHFSNRAVTNGVIQKALIPTLNHHGRWSQKQIDSFVSELVPGLWIDRGDHFEIHDYEHHQAEAMKERVERKKEYEREKKRAQRAIKDRKRSNVPTGVPTGQPQGHPTGLPKGIPPVSPGASSVPTRPDPISLTTFESDARETETKSPFPKHPPPKRNPLPQLALDGYLRRYRAEPKNQGIEPPRQARGTAADFDVWRDIAHSVSGPEQLDRLLDAAFEDDFVRKGFKPGAILSEASRLLANGPEGPDKKPVYPDWGNAPAKSSAPPALADAQARLRDVTNQIQAAIQRADFVGKGELEKRAEAIRGELAKLNRGAA